VPRDDEEEEEAVTVVVVALSLVFAKARSSHERCRRWRRRCPSSSPWPTLEPTPSLKRQRIWR
jgi:hypothetical protein